MASSSTPTLGNWFFVAAALIAASVALAGFGSTFFLPLSQGRFHAPPVVYAHAASTFLWIALFVLQPVLIRMGRYDIHVKTGAFGALLAGAVVFTGVQVGLYATERDLDAGGGATTVSSLVGVCTSLTMFLALVAAGIIFRSSAQTHKRLMLLATIVVLWPAWFRFRHYFPGVPRPDIWFAVVGADTLIVLAALRDWLVVGRIHPVWLFVGPLVILEQSFEVIMFDTPAWRAFAQMLFCWLR